MRTIRHDTSLIHDWSYDRRWDEWVRNNIKQHGTENIGKHLHSWDVGKLQHIDLPCRLFTRMGLRLWLDSDTYRMQIFFNSTTLDAVQKFALNFFSYSQSAQLSCRVAALRRFTIERLFRTTPSKPIRRQLRQCNHYDDRKTRIKVLMLAERCFDWRRRIGGDFWFFSHWR